MQAAISLVAMTAESGRGEYEPCTPETVNAKNEEDRHDERAIAGRGHMSATVPMNEISCQRVPDCHVVLYFASLELLHTQQEAGHKPSIKLAPPRSKGNRKST
jgi:hypothetical protein